jgi:hypothetical protein
VGPPSGSSGLTPPTRPTITGPATTRSGGPAKEQTLRGTVAEGVEARCVVLIDESGAVLANLQGLDLAAHPLGSLVQVTGIFMPDLMTTCQQGTPFEVRTAVAL